MAISTKGFGAYDVRGLYPEDVNEELAYRVGRSFVKLFNAKKVAPPPIIHQRSKPLWS